MTGMQDSLTHWPQRMAGEDSMDGKRTGDGSDWLGKAFRRHLVYSIPYIKI